MQGLENIGATCAINSMVQIICRNNYLRDTILKYDLPNDTLTFNLKEILILMHEKEKSLIPKKFVKKIFNTFDGIFRYGEQLDIYELWLYLSESINEEIKKDPKYYTNISNDIVTDKIKSGLIIDNEKDFNKVLFNSSRLKDKFEYYNIKLNNNKKSQWQNLIQGFYLNITKCMKCNNTLYNFEPFTTLNLNITYKNISVVDMVKQIYKEEVNCGDWECEKCKEKTEYKKQTKLWKLPSVLFIVINRFTETLKKNTESININETLHFNKGTILSDVNMEKNYKLSSIALHIGSLDGGHYMAVCNNNTDNYFLYNDMEVSEINNFKNDNNSAYMIVYSEL
tara:strand:- start:249 stop:1265 length:1017 start_codon:yes stop_codon:yes gene_type:complete